MSPVRFLAKTICALSAMAALVLPASAAYVRVHADAADMTYIDGGAPDKNFAADAVSKLLVNFADGEVSAKGRTVVLLRLPEAVLSADAATLARADLVFAVPRARNWDPGIFTPVLAPLAEPYVAAEATWNQPADGASWAAEGADVLATGVTGTYRTNSATLAFDLLPLLADPGAAAALSANGAAIRLAWTELPEADSFAMLQLSSTAEASAAVPDVYFVLSDAQTAPAADIAVLYGIDASKPTANLFTDDVRFVINPDENKGDSRVLVALPRDLDPPTLSSLGALRFDAAVKWNGNPEIPAYASVLNVPFGTTEATAATWTLADHSDESSVWNGGDFASSPTFPVTFGDSFVEVDLSPLLENDGLRGNAFANGLVIQWDTSARASMGERHAMVTHFRDSSAPTLAYVQRPVTHSYIDSGKPTANFGWSGADKGKCIVVFNPGEGEARSLLKFAPSFFDFDPAQQAAFILAVPYWKEWPAEEDADEDNSLVLNPLTTPFRMDQATWNNADNDTPWTTAGGDYDASVAVNAAIDRDAKVASFDLTALFRDPVALANLRDNGAIIRLGNAAHPVGSGSIGFNFFDNAPGTAVVEADVPVFRAVASTPAAEDTPGTRTLDLTGLDPLQDYELVTCSDLVSGEWAYVCDVPDSGVVVLDAASGPVFYCVRIRQPEE